MRAPRGRPAPIWCRSVSENVDRVFLPSACLVDDRFVVKGRERHHLADSLRVRRGDLFLATDGEGQEFVLETAVVSRLELVATIRERTRRPPGPGHRVTLALAPPKGRRMEIAIEKSVECGVGRIVPLLTERSVVRSRQDSERMERWRRVARSATAQSGRVRLPFVEPPRRLADVLQQSARVLLTHPGEGALTVGGALRGIPADEPILLLVGPEGGFAEPEQEEARRAGAIAVSLGRTRLRSETAAIVAVALAVAALSESD